MSDILIGVDIGTTVLKAAAFDTESGRVLARVLQRLKMRVGSDGAREQSSVSIERALRAVFTHLRSQLGWKWRKVCGIGLAAQGGSAIIVDRRTGKAFTPMVLWNDARAIGYLPHIQKRTTPAFWRRYTLRNAPGMGLARILWLKETQPELLISENLYVGAGEYCYFRMTDLWRQDACNALQTGCYNAVQQCLDQRLFDLVDMPLSFVAPMRRGHEVNPLSKAGARRLDLPAGIPVAGPYMDHEAGYLSAAGTSKRPLQCSLGTAWVGNFILTEDTRWTSPFQFVLPAIVGKGRLVVQPLFTGNVTWDWGLERLVDPAHAKALGKLTGIFSKELLPSDGLTALPWFNVSNPLVPSVVGGGTFFGMSPHTEKEDLLRALAASMVFEMVRVFAEVKDRHKVDSVVLGGGASKGSFFRCLFAALFQPLPVFFLSDEDLSGARGALYPFSRTVAKAKTKRVPLPDQKLRVRIARGYERYVELFERLYGHVHAGSAITFKKQ